MQGLDLKWLSLLGLRTVMLTKSPDSYQSRVRYTRLPLQELDVDGLWVARANLVEFWLICSCGRGYDASADHQVQ